MSTPDPWVQAIDIAKAYAFHKNQHYEPWFKTVVNGVLYDMLSRNEVAQSFEDGVRAPFWRLVIRVEGDNEHPQAKQLIMDSMRASMASLVTDVKELRDTMESATRSLERRTAELNTLFGDLMELEAKKQK